MRERDAPADMWGGIPNDWRVVKLKRAVYIPTGLVDPENEEFAGLRLIAPNHVESKTGRLLGEESAEDQGASSGKFLVEAGEVIYSKIRPALNKACLAPERCLCSADMYPMRPTGGLLAPEFLLYALLSQPFLHRAVDESMRVAMPKINRDSLGALDIPLPPLPTQRAIASFLDHETQKIDTLIEKKRRLLDLLEEKRTALITRAVTRGFEPEVPMRDSGVEWLGEIPEHWKVMRIGQVTKRMMVGSTPPTGEARFYDSQDEPWYGPGSFSRHLALGSPSKLIAQRCIADGIVSRLEGGSILLVTIGATLGRVAFAEKPSTFNQQITGIHPNADRIEYRFLAYQLSSVQDVLRALSPSTTLPILNQRDLSRFPVAVPPLAEQERTVQLLLEWDRWLSDMRSRITRAVSLLQEYRTALISAAVTGKIDVHEKVSA